MKEKSEDKPDLFKRQPAAVQRLEREAKARKRKEDRAKFWAKHGGAK